MAISWVAVAYGIYYVVYVGRYRSGTVDYVLWLIGLVLVLVLAVRLATYFLRLERVAPGEQLFVYPESLDTPAARAAQREAQAALAEETEAAYEMRDSQRIKEINDASRQPWRCPQCSSENPATFDLCWQCEQVRPS